MSRNFHHRLQISVKKWCPWTAERKSQLQHRMQESSKNEKKGITAYIRIGDPLVRNTRPPHLHSGSQLSFLELISRLFFSPSPSVIDPIGLQARLECAVRVIPISRWPLNLPSNLSLSDPDQTPWDSKDDSDANQYAYAVTCNTAAMFSVGTRVEETVRVVPLSVMDNVGEA